MMVRTGRASVLPFTPGTIAPVACATPALPWLPVVQQQLESKCCRSPGHWSCHCQSVDVPPIALTMLAVHGCPMAGYALCSSVLTEVACDNCGSPDHPSYKCPQPRDEAKITKAKEVRTKLVVGVDVVMVEVAVGVTVPILGVNGVPTKVILLLPVLIHLRVMVSKSEMESG